MFQVANVSKKLRLIQTGSPALTGYDPGRNRIFCLAH